jgi:predicted nucleic acid-binding protein
LQAVKLGKALDEEGEAISDVENVLSRFDIKVRDSNHQFREMDDVLEDTARVWKELGKQGRTVDQSLIATTLAGIRQRENLVVLLNNWDQYTVALNQASAANDTAKERFEIYNDSIEASANRSQAAWEGLWQAVIRSDAIKFVQDFGGYVAELFKMGPQNYVKMFLGDKKAQEDGVNFLREVRYGMKDLAVYFYGGEDKIPKLYKKYLEDYEDFIKKIEDRAKKVEFAPDKTKDDTFEDTYKKQTQAVVSATEELERYNNMIKSVKDSSKILTGVLSDYNEEQGLTIDQINKLKESTDDYSKYIRVEGEEVKLNKKALQDYALAKYDNVIADMKLKGGMEELVVALQKERDALAKSFKFDISDTLSGLTSVGDKILDIIDDAKKYGEISLEQVASLEQLYPEDYLKFLTMEGGHYRLNTEALKAFVVQKAEDAKASAIQSGATQQEIAVLQAYIDQLRSGIPFSAKKAEDAIKEYNDALKEQEKAYQDLLDDTIDMLKEKAEAERDALQEKLDGYKAVIDAQKEAIDREEDEHDYNKEMEDKKKKVSDIEAEIAELQFDTSLEAAAKRKKLEEELAEAREDLEETEHDRSVDLQKEALDDEYERYKAYIDQKVKDIEEYLKNTGQLTSEAIDLLNGKSGEFYNSLLEWNKKFGTGIDEDIIAKWQKAFEVIQQYQQAAQNAGAGSGAGGNQEETPEEKEEPKLLAIGTRVKMDGSLYSDSEGQGEGATINGDNYNGRPLIVRDYKEGMTAPYLINNLGWAKMDSVKAYHTGMEEGFVGGRSLLKSNEQFAKLMKGEAVINSQQMDNFVSNILPSIASSGGGNIKSEINIAINGNLDKSVLPKLEDIVNKSIEKLNQTMDRRGYKRNATNFAI